VLSFKASNLEISGKVQCLKKTDCIGLEIKMTQSGIANIPDRVVRTTTVDEEGKFVFKKVQKLQYEFTIEENNYCWVVYRQRAKVDKDSIDSLVFQQKGY
jgi:hypothetical protein